MVLEERIVGANDLKLKSYTGMNVMAREPARDSLLAPLKDISHRLNVKKLYFLVMIFEPWPCIEIRSGLYPDSIAAILIA